MTTAQPPAYRVVIATPTWVVNGVNVFSANLARGLIHSGVPSTVLLTEEDTDLIQTAETLMPSPADVPFELLPVASSDGWGMHWGAMTRYLEESSPCVYIPNYDWRHSCVCPRLSDNVVVVGVVHSDDPLHYDHVRRLGSVWNAIVAVSHEVARRTAEACPSVADRIVTIPIGVRLPAARPHRADARALRLVYHGALKQHQKRVLDLPRIVEAASALGVPVELSIAGAGVDEMELRAAAAAMVERGSIRFLGALSPDDTAGLLDTQDVYLLASEFEGMPNALLEAMGHGCVPVVTRSTSGIPDLVRDGENGFLVAIGDMRQFAERLHALWCDPARRDQMSSRAFDTVRLGPYNVDAMVASYQQLFSRAWDDVRARRFIRPRGPLSPPPAQVAGVNVFPVPLPHLEPDLGAFPSSEDAEDYLQEVRATPAGSIKRKTRTRTTALTAAALNGLKVVVSVPVWTSSGTNAWSEDLVRGLRSAGLDARLLLTAENSTLLRVNELRLPHPTDIPVEILRITGEENWGARWGAMLRTLETAAPCTYFPGDDWRHSCIVPLLSDRVTVIGSLHDTWSVHTDHAARLVKYWNGFVATNREAARYLRRQLPSLEKRLVTIPHGLDVPAMIEPKSIESVVSAVILEVKAGSNETARRFAAAGICTYVSMQSNRQEWLARCRKSHFVVATAHSDGARRQLIEAMGHGCVPVWVGTEPPSDLVRDDDTGLVAPPGGWDIALHRVQKLAAVPDAWIRVATRAHKVARHAGYCMDRMIGAYLELIARLMDDRDTRRVNGRILPPAELGRRRLPIPKFKYDTALGTFPSRRDAQRFVEESGRGDVSIRSARHWR